MQRECITQINDEAHTYSSALLGYTQSDAFLTKILMCQGKMDTFCLKGLKDLIKLCVKDRQIARYIYNCPGQTLQWHKFIDWFEGYLNYQAAEMAKIVHTTYSYKQHRDDALSKTFKVLPEFKRIMVELSQEDEQDMQDKLTNGFEGLKDQWLSGKNPDVLEHFPPRYIVGAIQGEPKVLLEGEDQYVEVKLIEHQCEYMYSNPTGMFNLSMPDVVFKNPRDWSIISY